MGKTYRSMEDHDDEYDEYDRKRLAKAKKKIVKQFVEYVEQKGARDHKLDEIAAAPKRRDE